MDGRLNFDVSLSGDALLKSSKASMLTQRPRMIYACLILVLGSTAFRVIAPSSFTI